MPAFEKKKYDLELRRAARANNPAEVRKYIAKGADVTTADIVDRTILHNAASWGATEAAIALVVGGVDIEAQDNSGDTALHTAIKNGKAETAIELIKLGASTETENRSGKTPLSEDLGGISAQEASAKVREWISLTNAAKLNHLHKKLHRKRAPSPRI